MVKSVMWVCLRYYCSVLESAAHRCWEAETTGMVGVDREGICRR